MSITSTLHKIAAINSQDSSESAKTQKDLLEVYRDRLHDAREEKVDHAKEKVNAKGNKARLKHRVKELTLQKNIQNLKSQVKKAFSEVRDTHESSDQNMQMVKRVMKEVGDGACAIQEREGLEQGMLQGLAEGGTGVNEALHANITQKNEQKKDHRVQTNIKNKKAITSLEEQKQAVKQQIKALGKMSFFKKLMKIVSVVAMAVVTVTTSGIGTAAVTGAAKLTLGKFLMSQLGSVIAKMGLGLIGAAGGEHYKEQLETAQGIAQGQNQMYQNLLNDTAKDQARYEQSKNKVQKMIQELESAQIV